MREYAILADTSCDLTKEIRERFNIDYITSHVVMPDRTERVCKLEWDIMPEEEFYKSLKQKGVTYQTSPANIDEYAEKFASYAREGKDVLCICISTALSGTYSFASKGAEQAAKEFPEAKFIVIDSLRYSALLGLMLVYASKLRDEGKTIEENAAWLEEHKSCFHQMGYMDDLRFLASKGRVSNAAAFFGQMIGIKPMGDADATGLTTVLGKAKGDKAAFPIILDYIAAFIEHPEDQIIFICNSARQKQAETFKAMFEERFHPKEIVMTDLFMANGINMGPGLMCAYFFGKPASEGLKEEQAVMTKLLG